MTTAPKIRGTPLEILGAARMWVSKSKMPYLSKLLWSCTYILTDKVPTMGVDKHLRVYVNPKHVEECLAESFEAVIAGVIHEALHPFMRHASRAERARCLDHAHANKCQDCELAQHIVAGGVKLWSKDITHEQMGWPPKLTFEEYYKLPRPPQPQPQITLKLACSGGSGATGKKAEWELPAPGEKGFDEKKHPSGLSEGEVLIVGAATAQAIKDHIQAHGIGSVPAGLARWAEEYLLPPPLDFAALINAQTRYWIEQRRGPVASYARPSRRAAGGLILPVHRNPRSNVYVVGDTSGSMDEAHDLALVIGTVYQAIETLGSVFAIGCDAHASDPVECRHIDDLRAALVGGGGTDMGAGIAAATGRDPDAVLVVTDGGTPWPSEDPGVPVIVVFTRANQTAPAWAAASIDASGGASEAV